MNNENFKYVAATELNSNYNKYIERLLPIYQSNGEIRSPFARDYTRILHCGAYSRLKHKTQVFYNIESDHICTRMEHVLHVESVSYTIAKYLGLNDELTRAIATGHDLGHAPFGHYGESILNELTKKYLGDSFWHEKNGLYFVDNLELLPDHNNEYKILNLTYAVRDGIISHCGERDINQIMPRREFIDLNDFVLPGQFNPITYEGCVVKMSDKIAYVGRDIEDAMNLGFLEEIDIKELSKIVKLKEGSIINTSTIMSNLILDVCENSSVERGICLSDEMSEILNKIKKFNYEHIYKNERFEPFKKYAEMVIKEIFELLYNCYNGGLVFEGLKEKGVHYPMIIGEFTNFLTKYCDSAVVPEKYFNNIEKFKNIKIYHSFKDEKDYVRAIIDYIAGMTDRYAVKVFSELITY